MTSKIKGLSIRRKILLLTIVPIFTSCAAFISLALFKGHEAAEELAWKLSQKSATSIENELLHFLYSNHLYLQTQIATAQTGRLNLEDAETMENYLWQQLRSQNQTPIVSSQQSRYQDSQDSHSFVTQLFYFDLEHDDKFVLVERKNDGQYISKYRDKNTGEFREVYTLDNQGNRTELIELEKYPDPRTRPWYKTAIEARKAVWSPIYTYAGEPRLGISGVASIYDQKMNKIHGIFAVDVTLDNIDRFLDSLEISHNGKAFILARSGELVASSGDEPLVIDNQVVQAINSQEPLVADAAQLILNTFTSFNLVQEKQLEFFLGGQEQMVSVQVIRDQMGLDWILVVVIPESDFMGNVYALALQTLIIGVSMAIAITFAASTIAQKMTRPIKKLTQASQLVAEGNFNQTVEINRQDELGILADSFNQMTGQLCNLIETEVELESVQKQLEIGRQIQHDFLPDEIPNVKGWETSCVFQPAYEVAGDFYDIFLINEDQHLCFIIADVCDKGLGAALFMSLFRSLLRGTAVQYKYSPYQALQKAVETTNNYVANNHYRTNMFATVFFGVLEIETGCLSYINGGHESPIIISESGEKQFLKTTGPAVGLFEDAPYNIEKTEIKSGETIIGFTDGVLDARSPEGKSFKQEKLLEIIEQDFISATEITAKIRSQLTQHIQTANQFDDITLLAIRKN